MTEADCVDGAAPLENPTQQRRKMGETEDWQTAERRVAMDEPQ